MPKVTDFRPTLTFYDGGASHGDEKRRRNVRGRMKSILNTVMKIQFM